MVSYCQGAGHPTEGSCDHSRRGGMLSTITLCPTVKAGVIPLRDLVTIPGGKVCCQQLHCVLLSRRGHPTEGSCDHSRREGMLSTITWCRTFKAGGIPKDLVTIPSGKVCCQQLHVWCRTVKARVIPLRDPVTIPGGEVCCQQLHGVVLSRRGSSH